MRPRLWSRVVPMKVAMAPSPGSPTSATIAARSSGSGWTRKPPPDTGGITATSSPSCSGWPRSAYSRFRAYAIPGGSSPRASAGQTSPTHEPPSSSTLAHALARALAQRCEQPHRDPHAHSVLVGNFTHLAKFFAAAPSTPLGRLVGSRAQSPGRRCGSVGGSGGLVRRTPESMKAEDAAAGALACLTSGDGGRRAAAHRLRYPRASVLLGRRRRRPPRPRQLPVHAGRAPGWLPAAGLDDAAVRRLRLCRGDQHAASGCCWIADRPVCRWPSTCPPSWASTPTTRWLAARSVAPAWRSTRSRTCGC